MATTRGCLTSSARTSISGGDWFRGWWPTAAQTPGSDSAMATARRLLEASTPIAIRSLTPAWRTSSRSRSTSFSSSRWMCVSTSPRSVAGHPPQLLLDHPGVDLLEERAGLAQRRARRQCAGIPAGRAVVLVALDPVPDATLFLVLTELGLRRDHVAVAEHLVQPLPAEG